MLGTVRASPAPGGSVCFLIETSGGAVTRNGGGSVRWVAERRNADNEREIAEIVAEAMGEGVKWPG
jgi:hypothetical protein